MMKSLKLWQKTGLTLLVALPLALGLGFTPKQTSQGLESKLPSISVSTAEAKEVKTEGYEVPDLTGLEVYGGKGKYLKSEPKVYVEGFFTQDGGRVTRISYDDGKERKVFGYGIDHDRTAPLDYGIYDMNGDGVFESKYGPYEDVKVPEWVKS